jgi:hypothetical protein
MAMRESLAKHSVRIFGPPPPKGAPEIETWTFVRRIYSRSILFTVPVWVLVALDRDPTWVWIVLGVGAAIWLQGFISVNRRIRRLRNAPPEK